jgi:3-hydroxypropanoate dehydrogenase
MDDIEQADAQARLDAAALKKKISRADPDTLALLFTEARSHNRWRDEAVSEAQLRALYDIAKMGPTSLNQQPMRLVFVQSAEAKKKLAPALTERNQPKMLSAPVTAIIAYDMEFYQKLPELFPLNPKISAVFEGNEANTATNAFRNGTLQGAYFMLAARAVGLDVGPMSGFDNALVDEAFFAGTPVKSNFLCPLGYADETKIFRRLPRLDFDEVAQLV